ncbi:hypothetical protein Tco_0902739 [Tanacetum coccineum]
MGTKVTSSSGSVLEELDIQKLQMQVKNLKENSLNKLNALKSTQFNFSDITEYMVPTSFCNDSLVISIRTFKFLLVSQHMNNLETLLNAETLHEMDSKSALSVIKVQFERIQQCKVKRFNQAVTSSGDETSRGLYQMKRIEKKKLEAHYGFMAKIQEVLPAESSSIDTAIEQLQNHRESNCEQMKDNIPEQSESINDTYYWRRMISMSL